MPDLIDIVVLFVALGLVGIAVLAMQPLRQKVKALQEELTETKLALEGANNRLEQARSRMALLSNTDPITGLMVRHVIVERFQLSLALAHAQGTVFGVVLVQLTDFEHLADLHGRIVADKLLTVMAERLQANTSETDTVGRVRDHEFAILVPVLRHEDEMLSIANRLRDRLVPPIAVPGLPDVFRLHVHVAGASYPRDGENWTSLLKTADERLRASRMQLT